MRKKATFADPNLCDGCIYHQIRHYCMADSYSGKYMDKPKIRKCKYRKLMPKDKPLTEILMSLEES